MALDDGAERALDRRVYQNLIMVAAIAFMVLPFITTFNEFLTKIVEGLQFVSVIQGVVAPFIVRIVVAILRALGIPASINGSFLYLTGGWMPLRIYLNWNCIGWQSFVLLAFTLVTGLQGLYTVRSKILTILLGLEGTFLVNIARVLIPTILAYYAGYIPAIIFHDYLGTLFTLLWMAIFWNYAFGNILATREALMNSNTPLLHKKYREGLDDQPDFKIGRRDG